MKNLFTKITLATAVALLGASLFVSAPAKADPTKKCGTVVTDGDKNVSTDTDSAPANQKNNGGTVDPNAPATKTGHSS